MSGSAVTLDAGTDSLQRQKRDEKKEEETTSVTMVQIKVY